MIAQRDSTRMVVSKPRKEASGESNPAYTLILDIKPPEPRENDFYCLQFPVNGILLQRS